MVVRIRLARHGTRNNPFYHLVAIRDKAARDALPIEKLGEYDPIPRPKEKANQPVQAWEQVGVSSSSSSSSLNKSQIDRPILTSGLEKFDATKLEKRIEWNVQRIHHWLSVGAQPSKPVARLLDRAGLIPEGKWYKGMYRPQSEASQSTGSSILAAIPRNKQKKGPKEDASAPSHSPNRTSVSNGSTVKSVEQSPAS